MEREKKTTVVARRNEMWGSKGNVARTVFLSEVIVGEYGLTSLGTPQVHASLWSIRDGVSDGDLSD
jgi:hypothetical protein